MTFISHAQNAEDVMLWRALRDVRNGFWIDVGAADPESLSVTRAFSEWGWTGVNVEPNEALFRKLAAARPRDVNLRVALGRAAGTARFHVFGETGLSCLDEEVAAAHRAAGYDERVVDVPIATLAEICACHAHGTIHFLKIDVEGAEADVIAGGDWVRFRPWILLAEATRPLTAEATHAAWEHVLLAAGYCFVWFDGINRFYVAAEHHARLAPAFAAPPNALDDWERAAEHALRARAEAAETAVRRAGEASRRQVVALDRAQADLASGQARTRELHAAFADAMRAAGEARGQADAMADALALERRRLDTLLAPPPPPPPPLRATIWTVLRPVLKPPLRMGVRGFWRGVRFGLRVRAALRRPGAASDAPDAVPPDALPPDALPPPPASLPSPQASSPVPVPIPVPRPRPRADGMRPIRAVHQYHHATATEDAISNGLFLLRARLRSVGFESEIYAAHPHTAHRDEVRPLEEMPGHDDVVLLVHHSLGDPVAERIAAMPARKILVYHNITPAALLDAPLADLARQGRAQLDSWRPHVRAAIADSEINALELRRRGFAPIAVANLLLDVAAFARRAAATQAAAGGRGGDGAFTVLFVGRVVPSKRQAELVDAFAAFRRARPGPARLVLVGHDGGGGYPAAIAERAAAHAIADDVVLTGPVDDASRDRWYSCADLFVSMSAHEGFGVPLVEAMAFGVPVLARRAGAVAFTLGGAGLLVEGGAEEMGAAMAEVAGDPELRARLVAGQRRRLAALAAEEPEAVLLRALALAGAAPPRDPVPVAGLRDELHVTVAGHVNGSYSLAGVNRTLALALEAEAPGRTSLLPVESQPGAPLFDLPRTCFVDLAVLAARHPVRAAPHVVLSQHYPVWSPDAAALGGEADLRVAFFFWEESLVPPSTIAALEAGFDAVLAPSRFVARALVDSGCRLPVRHVGYAPPLEGFAALADRPERRESRPFTFLHVSSAFPRKGVDVLLAAWARAFTADDPVRLVLKTFPNPHNTVAADLAALQASHRDLAPVVHIDMDLPPEELHILYLGADAVVLPTRGEGFNVPAAEAMAAGIPLVASAVGGHLDFVGPDTAILVEGRHAPAASHLSEPGSLWFEPDAGALAAALRTLAERSAATEARAQRARTGVREALDGGLFARRVRAELAELLAMPRPAGARRIALLTSWGVRCGVAEYSRQMVEALVPVCAAELTVLADRRTPEGDGVRHAWSAGDGFDPEATAAAVAAVDPEILLVQHQPGLVPWDRLSELLRDRRLRRRVVAVTLHSTRHLWTLPDDVQARVLAALAETSRVIVHGADDLDAFRARGLENVVVVPQGAPAPFAQEAPGSGGAHDAPLVGTYGFLLPHKGFGDLVAAFALLRRTHPGARLRMVTAAYDGSSDALREALAAEAARLGVADGIEWHTDFLPPERSLELLAGCDVVVMPYERTLEASSAALRTALAALRPTLVTPIPIFQEASDVVAVLPAHGPGAIRDGIVGLLADPARCAALVERQRAWLIGRSWPRIARRTFGMLEGLLAERDMRPAGRAGEHAEAAVASSTRSDSVMAEPEPSRPDRTAPVAG